MSSENAKKLNGLRKRQNILHRAQVTSGGESSSSSTTSSISSYAMIERPAALIDDLSAELLDHPSGKSQGKTCTMESLPTEYSSASHDDQSSDDSVSTISQHSNPQNGAANTSSKSGSPKLSRPVLDTSFRRRDDGDVASPSTSTRAWYEFDLAVVVALVSPIGNWLTGGDHIKNLAVIVFLIFYLHQIIEVPWALYSACRPKHSTSQHVKPPRKSIEAKRSLESLEFAFLSLTIVSPFVGAIFLRIVSNAVLGPDALSWFSVSLFVLATGLRPWRHLVARATSTAEELQEIVCQGACQDATLASKEESQRERERQQKEQAQLIARMEKMEKALAKFKSRLRTRQEEVYDYVDEAVEDVEKRVTDMHSLWEQTIRRLSSLGRRHPSTSSVLSYISSSLLPGWLAHSLPSLLQPSRYIDVDPDSPHEIRRQLVNGNGTAPQMNGTSSHDSNIFTSIKGHSRNPSKQSPSASTALYTSPAASSSTSRNSPRIRLETIPEDGPLISPEAQSPTWISSPTLMHSHQVTNPSRRRREHSGTGSLFTLPLRLAGRMVSSVFGYS